MTRPTKDFYVILLNLGCGTHAPANWQNLDRSPSMLLDRIPRVKGGLRLVGVISPEQASPWPRNIIKADLRAKLPYMDSSVDGIYSSHALEHLYLAEAEGLLNECFRVLKDGGIIRLALPDADLLVNLRAAGELTGEAFNLRLGMHPAERPKGIHKFTALFGGSLHKWQPTRDLTTALLLKTGFTGVSEQEWLTGLLPDLVSVESRPESFFLEALANHAPQPNVATPS